MGTLKLYSYSSELLKFVEAKWARAKLATCGILIGTIIFFSFGFVKLNQSFGDTPESRSANEFASENEILRQQIRMMSPRVSKLKMQVGKLSEQDNKLHLLLDHQEALGGTVRGFTYATKWFKFQSRNPIASTFRR
jgi:hypothetical protein